ncbi:MAG: hypothetical protein ACRYFU_12620 [Janthinobacterium lividum]
MAELTSNPMGLSRSRMAAEQLRAIAWLRWRILANGFRRKGGAGELIGRILLFPVFAAFALLPTLGAGVLGWYFVRQGEVAHIAWVLWGIFVSSQLLNVNLGQPSTTFDPVELIRFPMPLRRFVLIRLCFGVLGPANLIVSLMSVAVVAGITVAQPRLFVPSLIALFLFAITNILFTRMIFAWIDRWLSTRRAREVFTAFIFLFSISIQYVNVRFNPGFQHTDRHRARAQGNQPLQARFRKLDRDLFWLPPELIAGAVTSASNHHGLPFLAETTACAGFAAVFLAVYTVRMRKEFRGENISDVANAVRRSPAQRPPPAASPHLAAAAEPASRTLPAATRSWIPSTLAPLLGKELLVLRRNTGLFYGLVAPAVMVFLFAGRLSTRNGSPWVLLGAVAYSLLGISPMSYNSFGLEGTGAQFYFFAPVPLREVFFAKNVFGLLLALGEVLLVVAITTFVAGSPRPADCLFALLWAVGTLLFNMTLGNLRSVSAPKKVNPGRSINKAQPAVSGYIAMGIFAGCAALGSGCELLAIYLQRSWVGILLMTAFAAAACLVYANGLRKIEAYALERRDTLFQELGKKI